MRISVREQSLVQDFILLILSLSMGAAALYFWMIRHNLKFAGGLAAAALLFLLLTFLMSKRDQLILIDENGIFDRRLGVGPILWEDIESVQFSGGYGNRVLSLRLKDPQRYLNRMRGSQRSKVNQSHDLGFRLFQIDLRDVDLNLLDLKEFVERRITK